MLCTNVHYAFDMRVHMNRRHGICLSVALLRKDGSMNFSVTAFSIALASQHHGSGKTKFGKCSLSSTDSRKWYELAVQVL